MERTLNKVNFFNFITELEIELIEELPNNILPEELSIIEESKKKLLEFINEIKSCQLIESGRQFKSDLERLNSISNSNLEEIKNQSDFSIAARELNELSEKDRKILKQNIETLKQLENELQTPDKEK